MKQIAHPKDESKRSLTSDSIADLCNLEKLKNEEEAAELLGLSVGSLRRRRLLRQSPVYVRLGSRILYRPSDLISFVASGVRLPESTGGAEQPGVGPIPRPPSHSKVK